jgi:ribosomal protein S18 acetylase RimI-like enzyme
VRANAPVELWRFYVDRPWHGRGIAPVLMPAAVEAAERRGADALWLSVWEENARARSFYRREGFEQVGTQAYVVGTDVQNDCILVRSLAISAPTTS